MDTENTIIENKLPVEFKAKWVAALRSGEYKQGRAQLYNRALDTYCCLGVACKITAPSVEIPMAGHILHTFDEYASIPNIIKGYISSSETENAIYKLIRMNDAGTSFEEIADWIETNL